MRAEAVLVVKTRRKSPLAPRQGSKHFQPQITQSRKSSASLDIAWCHSRGLRVLRLKMLAL
jgi:hypothetical protein